MGGRERGAYGEGDRLVGIDEDRGELREQLVADGRELVAPLGGLIDQLEAVAHHRFEGCSGLGGWECLAHELGAVADLNALLELIVEVVGQAERVALIGLDEAPGAGLDVHDVDCHIHVQQVALQGLVVVSCLFHQDGALFHGGVRTDAVDEEAKALATIVERQGGAALEPLVPGEQRARHEAGNVPPLADINAHIQGVVGKRRDGRRRVAHRHRLCSDHRVSPHSEHGRWW